jgi:phosphoribosyl 1,2-cyclic phosphodiesterase
MKLIVLGSSSAGNCYILQNNSEALILEAGIKINEVKKALYFNIGKVKGCLVTHEHGDHAKYIKDLAISGIEIFASKGTFEASKINIELAHRANILENKKKYKIGGFEVLPFDVSHDAAEPFGFIIKHPDCGLVFFATDTNFIRYRFPGINHYLIESNYSFDIIADNAIRNRIFNSHMELNTTKSYLEACDLTETHNIVLLHLSDGNSDAELFKKEVSELTNKNTIVADKGLEIELNMEAF